MEPLIINTWKNGIADSQHQGVGLIRNADIEAFPGAMKVGKLPVSVFTASFSLTFTADATTDIMTTSSTTKTGTAVTVSNSGGALPTGLSAATVYWTIKISATTFKLASTLANAFAGTAINITDNGTGTQTVTSINPGTIRHQVYEPGSTHLFLQDSNARVWFTTQQGSIAGTGAYLLAGNTLTDGVGNGLCLFTVSDLTQTWLLVFRDNKLDLMSNAATNTESYVWTNGWKTLNSAAGSANSHEALLGQDNIVYFCDGRYIGSLLETPGDVFDPTDAASYTFNTQALDLPPKEIAQCLEELGINLLIGGSRYNKIYPWDRTADSFTIPLDVPEVSIKKMKNLGGIVYILAGTNGNIYYTQGTYVNLAKKLPDHVVNNSGTLQATVVTWGGIAARNGALIVGAGVLTSGNSGVYLLYPDGRLIIDNMPATGSTNVTSLFAYDEFYSMGYASGADLVGTTRYASFNTVFQSGLYRVATKTEKAKYSTLEVQVSDPATTGNIRVSYRRDSTSSFTTIGSTFVADSTTTSFRNAEIGITDVENIEVQVEMDGNFQLMEVRLIP